jgi:hypothetical protein
MIPEITTLKSGAKVELHEADFETANALFQAVAAEVIKVQTGIKFDLSRGMAGLAEIEFPLDAMKNVICQIAASKEAGALIMDCMGSCLYNGQKITRATFQPTSARQDYLPLALEVMKLNVLPFFSGLDLKSLTSGLPTGSHQK